MSRRKMQKPYPTCKHDVKTLKELQALPLKQKVFESRLRIAEWYEYWEGQVYVAFSGGKDSTVLLDLVRRDYPDVPAVFCDTGLEFPEIRAFVKTVENVCWIRPEMPFKRVLETYGYPIISKENAQKLREVRTLPKDGATYRLRTTGQKRDGTMSPRGMIPKKWQFLIHAPFKISEQCCDVMKKRPMKKYSRETGRKSIIGVMAQDSRLRFQQYIRHGCNAYENSRGPNSKPLSFWLENDIWAYIHNRGISYCPIYDMGYNRTGCVFCAFGAHMNCPNRFQRMKKTHPKLWKYCLDKLGLREVLDYCGIKYEPDPKQLELGLEEPHDD